MKIHSLHETPSAWLGEALERFEIRFCYPLGVGVNFRISHGRNYLPFFQAMGEATVWVAEEAGEVLGTLAASVRTLRLPDGEERRAAYLGDLKVAPGARAGRVLAMLARTATADLKAQDLKSAYAVVMGGTARTPMRYTGRLEIPPFSDVAEIVIFKVGTGGPSDAETRVRIATADEVDHACASLGLACIRAEGGRSSVRSVMNPVALLGDGGHACGVVEDTRRGKRLWLDSGEEVLAAHLSRFAYGSVAAGAVLVREALTHAAREGFPSMFFAVPIDDAPAFVRELGDLSVHEAPAKVYGHGLASAGRWSVDTAEI
jgi:hypothetical protein